MMDGMKTSGAAALFLLALGTPAAADVPMPPGIPAPVPVARMILEIDTAQAARDGLERLTVEVRRRFRKARIAYTGVTLTDESLRVVIVDKTRFGDAKAVLESLTRGVFTVTRPAPGRLLVSWTQAGRDGLREITRDETVRILRLRTDLFEGASVQREGRDRVRVDIPGYIDLTRLRALYGDPPALSFRAVAEAGEEDIRAGRIPPGARILKQRAAADMPPLAVYGAELLSSAHVEDAVSEQNPRTGEPRILITLDADGRKAIADYTRDHLQNRIAIVLDDTVISAPMVVEPVLEGELAISGSFTPEETGTLARQIRDAARGRPYRIVELRMVDGTQP